MHIARARGARLRGLNQGGRFGRHLFFKRESLTAAVEIAREIFRDELQSLNTVGSSERHPWLGQAQVEAVVQLKRLPLHGIRTVSARCPRRTSHRNGDSSSEACT